MEFTTHSSPHHSSHTIYDENSRYNSLDTLQMELEEAVPFSIHSELSWSSVVRIATRLIASREPSTHFDGEMSSDLSEKTEFEVHHSIDALLESLKNFPLSEDLYIQIIQFLGNRWEVKADALLQISSALFLHQHLQYAVSSSILPYLALAMLLRRLRMEKVTMTEIARHGFCESHFTAWLQDANVRQIHIPVSLFWFISEYQRSFGALSEEFVSSLIDTVFGENGQKSPYFMRLDTIPETFCPALVTLSIVCYWGMSTLPNDGPSESTSTELAQEPSVESSLRIASLLLRNIDTLTSLPSNKDLLTSSAAPQFSSDPLLVLAWKVKAIACCFFKRADSMDSMERKSALSCCIRLLDADPVDSNQIFLQLCLLRAIDTIAFTQLESFAKTRRECFFPSPSFDGNTLLKLCVPTSIQWEYRSLAAAAMKVLYVACDASFDSPQAGFSSAQDLIQAGAFTVVGVSLALYRIAPSFFIFSDILHDLEELYKRLSSVPLKLNRRNRLMSLQECKEIRVGLVSLSSFDSAIAQLNSTRTQPALSDSIKQIFAPAAGMAINFLCSIGSDNTLPIWLEDIILPLLRSIGDAAEALYISRETIDGLWDRAEPPEFLDEPPISFPSYFNGLCTLGVDPSFALNILDSVENIEDVPPGVISSVAGFVEYALYQDIPSEEPSLEPDQTTSEPQSQSSTPTSSPNPSSDSVVDQWPNLAQVLRPPFIHELATRFSASGSSVPDLIAAWRTLANAIECLEYRWSCLRPRNSDTAIFVLNTSCVFQREPDYRRNVDEIQTLLQNRPNPTPGTNYAFYHVTGLNPAAACISSTSSIFLPLIRRASQDFGSSPSFYVWKSLRSALWMATSQQERLQREQYCAIVAYFVPEEVLKPFQKCVTFSCPPGPESVWSYAVVASKLNPRTAAERWLKVKQASSHPEPPKSTRYMAKLVSSMNDSPVVHGPTVSNLRKFPPSYYQHSKEPEPQCRQSKSPSTPTKPAPSPSFSIEPAPTNAIASAVYNCVSIAIEIILIIGLLTLLKVFKCKLKMDRLLGYPLVDSSSSASSSGKSSSLTLPQPQSIYPPAESSVSSLSIHPPPTPKLRMLPLLSILQTGETESCVEQLAARGAFYEALLRAEKVVLLVPRLLERP